MLYVNRGEQLQTVGRPHRSHWVRNGHVLKIIWPEEQEARFGIGTHWGFLNIEALPLSWGVLVCTTILCSSTPRRQLSYEPFEPIFRMNDKFELGTSGGSVPEYVRNSVNVDTQPNSLDRALGRVDSMHPAYPLLLSGTLVLVISVMDWKVVTDLSLGVLFTFPMVIAATVLSPWQVVVMALCCAMLRALFYESHSVADDVMRFILAFTAYCGNGLFVWTLIRHRRKTMLQLNEIKHQQSMRQRAEEQLSLLVESSPAAVFTTNDQGRLIAANRAAFELFHLPPDAIAAGGVQIGEYLPVLADALRLGQGDLPFRTSAICQGRRANGEFFLANVWFSTFHTADGLRLAAIAVDTSEEMREREEQNLHQMERNQRILAGAVSHEVRNLCSAILLNYSSLSQSPQLHEQQAFETLGSLVQGLQKISSLELDFRVRDGAESVSLQEVLDQIRILIASAWAEIDGRVEWNIPEIVPDVVGDPSGLLQVFLNLSRNSLRAVSLQQERIFRVSIIHQRTLRVIIDDSGPGIADASRLFRPFQDGAAEAGIGLYVSRAIIRSYGGELRHEPTASGCRFVIELVPARAQDGVPQR